MGGWAGNPPFVMTLDYTIDFMAADYKSIVSLIKKEDWQGPVSKSFLWYDNDKDI